MTKTRKRFPIIAIIFLFFVCIHYQNQYYNRKSSKKINFTLRMILLYYWLFLVDRYLFGVTLGKFLSYFLSLFVICSDDEIVFSQENYNSKLLQFYQFCQNFPFLFVICSALRWQSFCCIIVNRSKATVNLALRNCVVHVLFPAFMTKRALRIFFNLYSKRTKLYSTI